MCICHGETRRRPTSGPDRFVADAARAAEGWRLTTLSGVGARGWVSKTHHNSVFCNRLSLAGKGGGRRAARVLAGKA